MLLLRDTASLPVFLEQLALTGAVLSRREASTESKRRSALRGIRQLEQLPLHPRAEKTRRRLLTWLIESPDFCVRPNHPFLSRLLRSDHEYARLLAAQLILTSAAFVLRHPDLAKERRACDRAAALGVLRTYVALLRADKKARWTYLDDLLERSREAVARSAGPWPWRRAA